MNRFLMLLGVAAIAGMMYVAAASGSQRSVGVTTKQFAALERQVGALSKKVKTAQSDVNSVAYVYAHCSLHSQIGIDRRGGSTFGYSYSPDGVNSSFATALDLDTSGTPNYIITPFNNADAGCRSLIGTALRQRAAAVFAQKFSQKP
jgi:hypothetical protein